MRLKLTSFVIHQKVFLHHFLLDAEEVQRLSQDLAELNVLTDRKLTRNASLVWSLRPVDNDLLCRWNVGRQQD